MNSEKEIFSLNEQFGLISEIFVITDDKHNLVYANEYARIRFDLDFQEFLGKPLQDFFTFLNPEILESTNSISLGETAHHEAVLQLNSGAQISINIRVKPFLKDEKIYFSWLLLDYDEEMENRQEMIDFMAQLNEARKKIQQYSHELEIFREMVDKVFQAVVVTNPEGKISFINKYARDLLGLSVGMNEENLIASFSHAGDFPVNDYKKQARTGCLYSEIIFFNRLTEKESRCYCSLYCVNRNGEDQEDKGDASLVWNFQEQIKEQEIRQQFIDYSAELASLNRELRKNNEEILRLSRADNLTEVYNRGYCLKVLTSILEDKKAYEQENCLLLFDLDDFKICNDTHGHLFGDQVLIDICQKAMEIFGDSGLVGRYGGEEFLVIFKGMTLDKAFKLSEKFRKAVSKIKFNLPEDKFYSAAITGGIDKLRQNDHLDTILERVDSAMYNGKNQGKNRIARWHRIS